MTQEEYDDDICPRGDCPKNMREAIKKAAEEEAKKNSTEDFVPTAKQGIFARDTVQYYFEKKKKCTFKSGY